MQTEGDYMMDSFLMLILAFTYLSTNGSDLEREGKFALDSKKDDDSDGEFTNPQMKNKVQPSRKIKDLLPYAIIVCSIKLSYFFDREKSLNFQIDPSLDYFRS